MALFDKVNKDKKAIAARKFRILEKFKKKIEFLQYHHRVSNDEICELLSLSKQAYTRFRNTPGRSLAPHRILILENWAAETKLKPRK